MPDTSVEAELRRGSAGHSGGTVRSDCRVTVEPATSGGVLLEIKSRVAVYYGDSIRQTLLAIANSFGVSDAKISIEDEGALPFTIAARVEAALRLAGYLGHEWLPDTRPRLLAT